MHRENPCLGVVAFIDNCHGEYGSGKLKNLKIFRKLESSTSSNFEIYLIYIANFFQILMFDKNCLIWILFDQLN